MGSWSTGQQIIDFTRGQGTGGTQRKKEAQAAQQQAHETQVAQAQAQTQQVQAQAAGVGGEPVLTGTVKKKKAGRYRTRMTSPLGIGGEADIARKTLLGM